MLDAELILSGSISAAGVPTGQAITASAASTHSLDLGSDRDIGAGQYINFNFLVLTTFATNDSLQIAIQSSANDSAFVDLLLSPVLLVGTLLEGLHLVYTLPRKQLNDPVAGTPNRYLRANYTIGGSSASAGSIFCWVTGGEKGEAFEAYPTGYSNAFGS